MKTLLSDGQLHAEGSSPVSDWLTPPADVSLNGNEVHVWRAYLDVKVPHVKHLRETLSAGELSRADRFHFQKDRDRFIAARGLLRLVLGGYLKIAPDTVSFFYGPFGKPELDKKYGDRGLRFNISHSQNTALFAFARDRETGVDLEYIRPDMSCGDIADKFFSRRESAALNALPEHEQQKAFFTLWTRKEAYLKARGKGLSGCLRDFDVVPLSDGPPGFFEIHGVREDGVSWLLRDLDAGPGYAAALAVEGHDWQLRCWHCNAF